MATKGCVFCDRIRREEYDLTGFGAVSFEPLNPVTPGHRLFLPGRHVADAREVGALTAPAALAASWNRDWRNPNRGEDFNLITSAGPAATQTVFHLHLHYIPRWAGDGLRLPWTDQPALAAQGDGQ